MNSLSSFFLSRLARGAIILSAVGIVIGVSLYAPVASAATFRGGQTVLIPANETVTGDIYTGGGTVSVAGTVNGDVVAGGGMVTVQGPVAHSVMVGGGNVILLGPVGGSVRVVGGNVTIGGNVTGDVVVAGGTLHTLSGAHIGGDAAMAGGSMIIDGSVAGKVYARGAQLIINDSVGNGVDAQVKSLSLGSTAKITGGMIYSAQKEVTEAQGAQVTGVVTYTPVVDQNIQKPARAGMLAFISILAVLKVVGFTILALLMLWLFRSFVADVSKRVLAHPGMSALLGFVFMVVVPIALVIILCTIIGIYVSLTGFLAYLLTLLITGGISIIVTGALLARMIKGKEIVDWKWTLLGAVVFMLLALIPIIGWLVDAIIYIVALGAMLAVMYEKYQK